MATDHCPPHIVFGTLSLALCHSNCEGNVPNTKGRRQRAEDKEQRQGPVREMTKPPSPSIPPQKLPAQSAGKAANLLHIKQAADKCGYHHLPSQQSCAGIDVRKTLHKVSD